ncbi:hypothetical protein [Bacteroides heparinolyticus]|uniref:hypothetical protein n=1 Tax=Prevotella heparinolytica TaxID=28113 RepID=UPI0035A1CA23
MHRALRHTPFFVEKTDDFRLNGTNGVLEKTRETFLQKRRLFLLKTEGRAERKKGRKYYQVKDEVGRIVEKILQDREEKGHDKYPCSVHFRPSSFPAT